MAEPRGERGVWQLPAAGMKSHFCTEQGIFGPNTTTDIILHILDKVDDGLLSTIYTHTQSLLLSHHPALQGTETQTFLLSSASCFYSLIFPENRGRPKNLKSKGEC